MVKATRTFCDNISCILLFFTMISRLHSKCAIFLFKSLFFMSGLFLPTRRALEELLKGPQTSTLVRKTKRNENEISRTRPKQVDFGFLKVRTAVLIPFTFYFVLTSNRKGLLLTYQNLTVIFNFFDNFTQCILRCFY